MKAAQKSKINSSYHISTIALRIHTNTCTTRYSLQSLFIHKKYNSITMAIAPQSNSSYLGRGILSFIYTKNIRSSLGGAQIPRRQTTTTERKSIDADLKLNWTSIESECQLARGLIELTHWPAEWIINHIAPRRAHTCGGEREGTIPHKGCWSSTLDPPRSPPSVKDCSDPVNIVSMRLISIKSVENPLI